MTENMGQQIGWDGEITEDSQFITLTPGEYIFRVTNLERAYFNGSEKMSACPQAIVHCTIDTDAGETTIKHNLYLNKKTEWALSAFFTSIGLKRPGETIKMEWNKVVGKTGRCKVKNREYQGSTFNEIAQFLPPAVSTNPAQATMDQAW